MAWQAGWALGGCLPAALHSWGRSLLSDTQGCCASTTTVPPRRGYVTQWDNYMDQIEPLVTRMPYMTVPGNHERDWPGTDDGAVCSNPPHAGPDAFN